MSVVLFALIGAKLDMGAAYWIMYGFYCTGWLFKLFYNLMKDGGGADDCFTTPPVI